MTTILVELEDASNIEKLLAFIKGLKGHKKVQITDEEKDILEAMQQMDKGIYHEVSREELFNLIDDDDDEQGVPLSVALDMVESLKRIKQVERGEIAPISWDQMMAELEADKLQEVAVYA